LSGLLQRALEARAEPSRDLAAVELAEDLLYFHVSNARRARLRLDRMVWSTEYADLFHQRELSIQSAKRHLATLRLANHPITELLQSMCKAEDIQL
jgi:hypothetical protein